MQTLEKPSLKPSNRKPSNLKLSNQSELIAIYLGYRIVLKRIWVKGVDKGWWLHWSHPDDQGKKEHVKFGQFLPDKAMLPVMLEQVKSMIETTVALECLEQPVDRSTTKRHWTERLRAWLN